MIDQLNGLKILNTRPLFAGGHQQLSEKISALGGKVISLPLQDIQGIPKEQWLSQLPTWSEIDKIIFVSRPAAHFFFQAIDTSVWPSHIQTIAIGSATAKTIEDFNIPVSYFCTDASSEALIQSCCFQNITKHHVVWIKGPHGRTLLGEHLKKQHASVIELNIYHSIPIEYSEEELDFLWEHDAVDIILISSEQALNHFLKCLPQMGLDWLQQKALLVFSERIKKIAEKTLACPIFLTSHHRIIHTLYQLQGLKHES